MSEVGVQKSKSVACLFISWTRLIDFLFFYHIWQFHSVQQALCTILYWSDYIPLETTLTTLVPIYIIHYSFTLSM